MTDQESHATRPGTVRRGGRTARTTQAVHDAVRDLVAERGREGLSIHAVAARAGVHEATIYRRWGDVDTLLIDAEVTRFTTEDPILDVGDLREELRAWAESTAANLARPGGFVFFNAVAAAVDRARRGGLEWKHQEAARIAGERGDQVRQALERARSRGEAVPDYVTVLDRLLAPLYLRAAFGYRAIDEDLSGLIEDALRD